MKRRKKEPEVEIPMPILAPMDGLMRPYDPFGSYTGIPAEPGEKPVQDADDL